MSRKTLKTGEMIDRIKKGDFAVCINMPEGQKDTVTIREDGTLVYPDSSGGVEVVLDSFLLNEARWIIKHKHISFLEAIQELKAGNIVYFDGPDTDKLEDYLDLPEPIKVYPYTPLNDIDFLDYTIEELVYGLWLKEEEIEKF